MYKIYYNIMYKKYSLKLMSFKHVHEYFSFIRFFKYYKFKTKIENHQTNHSYI